ncbi:MAG: response regulator [Thermogutta sp.]|uniref:response regulator n=1 Tax=Thermogutta sp. TaxID=1962930 RepID=UPI0019B00B45|nr:response regulator [Thermogutta sp.]MBC7352996.1 response regulator [Thermogutta sp.]
MTKLILLCDDELPILRAVEFKLKKVGFSVKLAQNGEIAWAMIQEAAPDLIVSDYQMPILDGLELAKRVRENRETQHIPFILLTGKGFELDQEDLRSRLGITRVLSKPFSPRELVEEATKILQSAEYGDEPAAQAHVGTS